MLQFSAKLKNTYLIKEWSDTKTSLLTGYLFKLEHVATALDALNPKDERTLECLDLLLGK